MTLSDELRAAADYIEALADFCTEADKAAPAAERARELRERADAVFHLEAACSARFHDTLTIKFVAHVIGL